VCTGNARCDVEIGETCATTPSDCGVCPTTTTSTGGSSGGGGSGGGGGTISAVTSNLTNQTNSGQETNGTGELLNGGGSTDRKTGINWLTGAVTGAFGGTGSVILAIFVFLVVASVILFFVMKTKENKNINTKIKEMIKKRG